MSFDPLGPSALKTGAVVIGTLIVLWLAVRWINGRVPAPKTLGVRDGRLSPCPNSPNCVVSGQGSGRHDIAPLPLPASARFEDLVACVSAMSGARAVENATGYVRFEFRTAGLGFTDDLELLADPAAGQAQVRSASRVGYSDLGVNRRRVEEVRVRWEGMLRAAGPR